MDSKETLENFSIAMQGFAAFRNGDDDHAILSALRRGFTRDENIRSNEDRDKLFSSVTSKATALIFETLVSYNFALEDLETFLRRLKDVTPRQSHLFQKPLRTIAVYHATIDPILQMIKDEDDMFLLAQDKSTSESSIQKNYDVYTDYVYTEADVDPRSPMNNFRTVSKLMRELSQNSLELVDNYTSFAQLKLGYFVDSRCNSAEFLLPITPEEYQKLSVLQKSQMAASFVEYDLVMAQSVNKETSKILEETHEAIQTAYQIKPQPATAPSPS